VPLSIDRLYQGLLRLGDTVMLFAPTYPQSWEDPQDQSIFRCPTLFHSRFDNFPIANTFSRKIEAAFKAFDGDLVHVHHPFWLGKKGLHLAKKNNIPVVFTYHTRLERYTHYIPLPGAALKNLVAHFLIKHFANRCDAIITPTASTEEYLRNLGVSALIETIPTGIRLEAYRNWSQAQVRDLRDRYISPGERLLISVSRMAQEKNLDFLIDGLVKVQTRSRTPFRCLLIGDGPEKQRLEQKVARLGMSDRIVFGGNMAPDDVIGRYLAADLFVFASTSETQGMVLLEAMAGACPVVAVRASGVYDVVKDGYNGFKVAESTDDWAETVAGLLDDDQRLAVMSRNSLAFAGDYSEEKMSAKVSRLYRRVTILHRSEKR
jgi:glycosyltransferase involved in cell wall biosynthesis